MTDRRDIHEDDDEFLAQFGIEVDEQADDYVAADEVDTVDWELVEAEIELALKTAQK